MSKIFLSLWILSGFFINEIFSASYRDNFLRLSSIIEIEETILDERQQIHDLQSVYGLTDEVLWLYNDLGISYFFKDEFLTALDKFDYILQQKQEDNESLLIGAALWGKAICHARLDMFDEMLQNLRLLESYFNHLFEYNCRSEQRKQFMLSNEDFHLSHLIFKAKQVQFENPNENISAAQCRDRVVGSANAIKNFIAPLIKDPGKQIIFIQFINGLESQGLYCCRDGSIWVSCVTPMLQKLENWKIFGIPADPAWD